MADLEITADFSSVTQGEKKVVQLERQLSRLIKRFDSGAVESDAFRQGLISLKREYSELGVSIQKASGQVEKYVKQTQKANAEQQKAARQKEWFAQQRRRIQMMEESRRMEERQTRESVQAQSQQERAAKSHADELERLARRYRPLYAASKLYENELNDVNRAHKEGVINARQHASAIDQLNQEYMDFQNGVASATNRFRGSMVGSTRSLNDFGMATQQVGYQVGDFLVQVQSGTNAFVAFGQQATQLVGILPMFASQLKISAGTLVGISAGLGIAIPLVTAIGAALMRTRDSAKEASSGIGSLSESIKTLKEETSTARVELLAFQRGLESVAEIPIRDRIIEIQEALANIGGGQGARSRRVELEKELEELQEILRNRERTRQQEELLVRVRRQAADAASAFQEQLDQQAARQREILALTQQGYRASIGFSQTQKNATSEYVAEMVEAFNAAQTLRENLGDAAFESIRLAGVDISAGITPAVAAAGQLAARLGVAYSTAVALKQLESDQSENPVVGGMGPGLESNAAMRSLYEAGRFGQTTGPSLAEILSGGSIMPPSSVGSLIDSISGSSSGSSGGGGAGEDELTNLEERLKAQQEVVKGHLEQLEAMEKGSYAVRFGAASNYFSDLVSLSGSSNEKLLGISKAFGAAQATINAYQAYTAALKDPNISVFGRLAAGAKVLAAGLGAVNAIRGIGKNGGGGSVGSSGGGSIATPQGQTQAPQRILIEGLDPSALYSGDMIQSIFDAIYDENEERGAVFMVAT